MWQLVIILGKIRNVTFAINKKERRVLGHEEKRQEGYPKEEGRRIDSQGLYF